MPQVKLKITKTDNSTLEIDRFSGLQTVESLTQSTPDASSIYYGTLANSGSAQIVDKDGEIKDLIEDGDIENSNTNVDLYIDDHLVQKHITTDSDYNEENIFSMQFTNKLEYWDKINYEGYPYPNTSKTAYEMLEDVLTKLGYSSNDINTMLGEQIIYGDNAAYGTIKSYLQLITIPYPYLPSDTYRNTIDKFCRLAQLQVYVPDNSDLPKFVSARPVIKSSQASSAIVVPKYAQLSKLNKTVILKNKYDAVEIQDTLVSDIVDYNALLDTIRIDTFEDLETNTNNSDAGQSKTYLASSFVSGSTTSSGGYYNNVSRGSACYLKNKYCTASFTIDKKSNMNLSEILSIYNYVNSGIKFSLTYREKKKFSSKTVTAPSGYNTSNSFTISFSDTSGWDENTKDGNFSNTASSSADTGGVETSVTLQLHNNATISYDEDTEKYTIAYTFLVGENRFEGKQNNMTWTTPTAATSADVFISGILYNREPLVLKVSLYGDKRTISFEDVSASDDTSSAKTIATIQGSELLQTETKYNNSAVMSTLIKNNIKSDYSNGISSGNIQLFCTDFFDNSDNKLVDFSTGSIIENNAIVSITGDDRKWRVAGRKFNYDGQSTTNIEVEEVASQKYTIVFPNSVYVYNGSTRIHTGDIVEDGTTLRAKFQTSNGTLNYMKLNGENINDNSTFTVSSNCTITVSYENKVWFDLWRFNLSSNSDTTVVNLTDVIPSGATYDSSTDNLVADYFRIGSNVPYIPYDEPWLSSYAINGTISAGSSTSYSAVLEKLWKVSGGNTIDWTTVGSVVLDKDKITITCSDTSFRGAEVTGDVSNLYRTRTIVE